MGIFDVFKRKSDHKLAETMMRAAAEGHQIAQLKQALAVVGVDVSRAKNKDDLASDGAVALLEKIKSNRVSQSDTDKYDFVEELMLFVFADHFSRILLCGFEMSTSLAFAKYFFGNNPGERLNRALRSYNTMKESSNKSLQAIGETCARWGNRPSIENLEQLKQLYLVLIEYTS